MKQRTRRTVSGQRRRRLTAPWPFDYPKGTTRENNHTPGAGDGTQSVPMCYHHTMAQMGEVGVLWIVWAVWVVWAATRTVPTAHTARHRTLIRTLNWR